MWGNFLEVTLFDLAFWIVYPSEVLMTLLMAWFPYENITLSFWTSWYASWERKIIDTCSKSSFHENMCEIHKNFQPCKIYFSSSYIFLWSSTLVGKPLSKSLVYTKDFVKNWFVVHQNFKLDKAKPLSGFWRALEITIFPFWWWQTNA